MNLILLIVFVLLVVLNIISARAAFLEGKPILGCFNIVGAGMSMLACYVLVVC